MSQLPTVPDLSNFSVLVMSIERTLWDGSLPVWDDLFINADVRVQSSQSS